MVKRAAPKKAPFKIDVCEKCMGVWLDSSEIDKLEEKNFSWGEKHALVFRNFKELFLTK
jgi:Zn-finger nucleic acid-binding protein